MPDFTKRNIKRESGDSGDRLQNRLEWLQERLGLADETLPPDLIARASRQKRAMEKQAAEVRALKFAAAPPIDPYWTPLGPSAVAHGQADDHPVVSGRVTALAVGPGGNRVYLGAANGGIWYSENSGASWNPINDGLPPQIAKLSQSDADSLSVGAMAVRFGVDAAHDEIFVGTGEPPGTFRAQYFGVGIKHSTSGGTAPDWKLESTNNLTGAGVFRIVIDPEKPEVVFAATTKGLFMRPQSGPVTDWTQITAFDQPPAGAAFSDIVVSGTGANKVYFAANAGGSVYRSTDAAGGPGGGSWKAVGGFTANGRVALAASEGTVLPRVYALDQSATLYRLENLPTGDFASIPGVPANILKSGDTDQSGYDLVVAVDPSNSAVVYVAGAAIELGTFFKEWNLAIYKGGVTLGVYHPVLIGEGIHPDGHVIAFATNADGTHDASNVWVGCDGGVFQSSKSGASGSFQARNEGLAITQLTYLAQHPATDQVLVAGSQDQGTVRFRGDQVGFEEPEGDGGGCAYDPNNGYRVMRQDSNASLYTSTDGANSWSEIKFPPASGSQKDKAKTESDSTNAYAPIAAVAVDASNTLAAFGTNRLWITSDWGDKWVTVPSKTNPYDGPDGNILTQDALDGKVRAIAWASPTRIYVASKTSVYRFDLSGGNWTPNPPAALPVTGLPADRTINSIAVEDAAAGKIYVALGGGNVDHVWYFDPAVGSWVTAGLTQAMLDVPCRAIVVDPAHSEQIYLGTDVGVFKGVKTGANWTWNSFSNQLPECAVTDLAIHPKTRVLRAATQGLGAWEIPLDVPSVADPDLYLRANSADSGRVPRPSFLHGMPDPNDKGTTLDLVSSPDIKLVRSSALGKPDTTPDFFGFASLRGFATDLNTFDTFGTNLLFVEVHNRGKTPVDGAKVRVLVLLADGSAALPALPADFATRLQNGDTSAWLTPGWHFADAANPYRTLTGALDVRTPQVVQYNVNFPSLGLTQSKVAAAAFVTTDADPFTSTETDANALIVPDKHVAVRTLSVGIDWRIVLGLVIVAGGVGVAIALAEKG